MKRTVKVLKHSDIADIVINEQGDCYDLIACEDCKITPGKPFLISLGISMQLPKGCYAKLYDRSSTPKKFKVQLGHSVGIIDNSFNLDSPPNGIHMFAKSPAEVSGTLPSSLYSGGYASKIIVISIYMFRAYPGCIQYIINYTLDHPYDG